MQVLTLMEATSGEQLSAFQRRARKAPVPPYSICFPGVGGG
jgi:hypothetical protein